LLTRQPSMRCAGETVLFLGGVGSVTGAGLVGSRLGAGASGGGSRGLRTGGSSGSPCGSGQVDVSASMRAHMFFQNQRGSELITEVIIASMRADASSWSPSSSGCAWK
jgi:hypothetical protein